MPGTMTAGSIALAQAIRPLFLQGPMSRFFDKMAGSLAEQSRNPAFQAFKINLNAGDRLMYRRKPSVDYTGTLEGWDWFLRQFIRKHAIDAIILFGDCRPYHIRAVAVAVAEGIPVFVLEEGYVRPDYITLERGGVNGYSRLKQDWIAHRGGDIAPVPPPAPTGQTLRGMAMQAALYYAWSGLHRKSFPHYQHHRSFSSWVELGIGVRGFLRKGWHLVNEYRLLRRLSPGGDLTGRYFLVPLQVSTDAQISHHSTFKDIPEFIGRVMKSFRAHADITDHLVLKHHPLDRGRNGYATLIAALSREYGLSHRVHYIHDGHLPTLLKHAKGMVTINSTTAMSAFFHGCPVKNLGEAVYDLSGLTFQKGLDAFWGNPGVVSNTQFERFRAFLIHKTQVNGSFYAGMPHFPWDAATRPHTTLFKRKNRDIPYSLM